MMSRIHGRFNKDIYKPEELVAALDELSNRIEDEISSQMFWFVPSDREKYFDANCLFGKKIEVKFPEMVADIEDAGLCLGTGCWTAGVYHLMRVMEASLKKLTGKLAITILDIEHKTWKEILDPIDAAVKLIPKKTNEQEVVTQAALHLRHVSIAWRNRTMHHRERYNQKEAEAIFAHVNTFVNHLADNFT